MANDGVHSEEGKKAQLQPVSGLVQGGVSPTASFHLKNWVQGIFYFSVNNT